MRIKIKQSIFSTKYGMLDNTNKEIEVDERTGKDLVNAGYAILVEVEKKEEVKKTVRKPVKKETPKETGEE